MHTLHVVGAYAFVLAFLGSIVLGIVGLLKKDETYLRRGAVGFIVAFMCLCIPYISGFILQKPLLLSGDEALRAAVKKHHDLSKFVLTGSILMLAACVAMLRKYKDAPLPGWLWPNLLFISWMVATFVIRSLLHGYRIPI